MHITDGVSLAAYVVEDGLVGHHWKVRPLGIENFLCLSTGEGKDVRVGGSGGVAGRAWGTFGLAFEL